MRDFFENKVTYNQISFHLTDKPSIDEREIHSYHEILLYIDGNAELLTKDGQRFLKNNSLIIIPKETYHFLRLTSSEKFKRLKISVPAFDDESIPIYHIRDKLRIFENLNENVFHIYNRLLQILSEKNDNTGFYAYSAFLMLISEIELSGVDKVTDCQTINKSPMTDVMEYISAHLSDDLSIKKLAGFFHMSTSGIAHSFKKEFGISLHKFIIQKRLICAQKLIHRKIPLTQIYQDIGFVDYSSFYKAYIRFFGYPPSKEEK